MSHLSLALAIYVIFVFRARRRCHIYLSLALAYLAIGFEHYVWIHSSRRRDLSQTPPRIAHDRQLSSRQEQLLDVQLSRGLAVEGKL